MRLPSIFIIICIATGQMMIIDGAPDMLYAYARSHIPVSKA